MKWSIAAGVGSAAACLAFAGAAQAQSCFSACNTSNMACQQAGKPQDTCLSAWHQCKTGCASKTTPAKLTVTRPSPNTVVIKTTPTKK